LIISLFEIFHDNISPVSCASRPTEWLSGSGGASETPSLLSRHFWQNAPDSSGKAAVRWSRCWAALRVYRIIMGK